MSTFRTFATAVLALVIAGACGSPAATPRPPTASASPSGASSTPPDATACDPASTGQATAYPGWPNEIVGDPEVVPSLVSSELGVGQNRFLFTIVDRDNKPVPAADVQVDLKFFDLADDPATPKSETKAVFLPTGDGRGLYRATVDFDCSGDWGVDMAIRKAGLPDRTSRGVFPVRAATSTPPIGSKMEPFDTPTSPPADLKTLTTDTNPDPDFYRTSVRAALDAKKPFLFVLATPAFCKTRTCGPALDLVKAAAAPFKDRVAFINVEPYQLRMEGGSLQPVLGDGGALQPIQLVTDLGLITEPYTFAVDRTGSIVAKFEGVVGRDVNLQQFATFINARAVAWGFDSRPEFANPQYLGTGTDWQKELFRKAPMTNHTHYCKRRGCQNPIFTVNLVF